LLLEAGVEVLFFLFFVESLVVKWVPAYGMVSAYAFGYGAIYVFAIAHTSK